MRNKIHICALCAGIMVAGGCVSPTVTLDLSESEWADYYALAQKGYNDPDVWRACGKEMPEGLKPHWNDLKPWGVGPGVSTEIVTGKRVINRDTVSVYVPVASIGDGEKGMGVPHVIVTFRYPGREIVDVHPTRIVF